MNKEKAIVEKSKQLIWARYTSWDAKELDVFETYLSRINARDPKTATVVFTKKEYENLMGLKQVRPEVLNKYLKRIFRTGVSIPTDRGWKNRPIFDKADLEKNEYGEWEVTLSCHPDVQDLLFSLVENGYQKYPLKYMLELKKKYSKLLYCLLKDNLYRGGWTVEIKELRELLGATEKSWESFKEFNRRILKVAQEEIGRYTDIDFTYEKITRGKITRAVKFKIEKKNFKEVLEDSTIIENEEYEIVEEVQEEKVDFAKYQGHRHEYLMVRMKETNSCWELNDAQADVINDQIYNDLVLPRIELTTDFANITLVKMEMIDKVLQFAAAGNAKNLYGWLSTPSVWESIIKKLR